MPRSGRWTLLRPSASGKWSAGARPGSVPNGTVQKLCVEPNKPNEEAAVCEQPSSRNALGINVDFQGSFGGRWDDEAGPLLR